MTPRLIDQIMSIDGLLVGISYIVAYSVLAMIAVGLLDWRERSKINRRMAEMHRARPPTAEDAARRVA